MGHPVPGDLGELGPQPIDGEVARRQSRDRNFVDGITKEKWKDLIDRQQKRSDQMDNASSKSFTTANRSRSHFRPLNSEIFEALYAASNTGRRSSPTSLLSALPTRAPSRSRMLAPIKRRRREPMMLVTMLRPILTAPCEDSRG